MILKTAMRFMRDESGQTAVEYGLIAALISVAGLAAYIALADVINAIWDMIVITVLEALQ